MQRSKRQLLLTLFSLLIVFGACADANAQKKTKKKHQAKTEAVDTSSEPDKVLFERATNDIKHGRYTEGRLAYQTLINTYPDSEFLAKAKLGLADSYFKEGGTSNLTQAVSEYKDFGTFFPFLDEAAYAQMQVGMCHYKMMEKADRDTTHAQQAEDEFQAMLLKYPQSKFSPEAEQHLREVQEVLADGDYRIARFYYTKQDFRASAARLLEVTDRYPLYSGSDDALWMLGNVYMWAKLKTPSANEDLRNYWSDLAAKCYERIIVNYPLSDRARDAKGRLKAMGKPIPAADPDAMARMQKEQLYAKNHHQFVFLKAPLGLVKGAPDVSMAAHSGAPNLTPPNDAISAKDVLTPGGLKPTFGLAPSNISGTDTSSEPTTQVDAAPISARGSGTRVGTNVGVQIIEAPTSSDPSASNSTTQPGSTASSPQPPVQPPPANGPTDSSSTPNARPTPPPPGGADSTSQNGSPASAPASSPASGQSGTQQPSSSNDPKQESTSKKKKGLRKLVPW